MQVVSSATLPPPGADLVVVGGRSVATDEDVIKYSTIQSVKQEQQSNTALPQTPYNFAFFVSPH